MLPDQLISQLFQRAITKHEHVLSTCPSWRFEQVLHKLMIEEAIRDVIETGVTTGHITPAGEWVLLNTYHLQTAEEINTN